MRIENNKSLEEIKAEATKSNRVVFGVQTCYWKIGDPVFSHPFCNLPCGPRGEMLMETDDPLKFIEKAEANPDHYGKHGIEAFVAAHHGNLVTNDGRPSSLRSWDEYNKLLDKKEGK